VTAKVSYFPGVLPPEAVAPEGEASDVLAPESAGPEAVAPESAPAETTAPERVAAAAGAPGTAATPLAPAAAKPLPTVWWNEEEPASTGSNASTEPAAAAPAESPTRGAARAASAWQAEEDDDEPAFEEEPMSEGERAAFLENIVVRALARKGLSEWEITKLLTSNGVEEHELEPFLDRYRDNRYIDDFDLAQTLVESLHRRKGYGRSQIKNELSMRHIQPEIISAALEALDDDDELRRAIEIAEKRAPSLARLDAATAERRLTSFLMRKGYPSAIIRTAVSAALTPQTRGVRFR
jgi:regulatory protein